AVLQCIESRLVDIQRPSSRTTLPGDRVRVSGLLQSILVSCQPRRNFPLASQRLCNRSPPRKFASCSQVTSRGFPSARKPVQDCKRFPSLLRPWLRSRARLLPVALPPDQTSPTRDNIARAHSSPSSAHSGSAGRAAI